MGEVLESGTTVKGAEVATVSPAVQVAFSAGEEEDVGVGTGRALGGGGDAEGGGRRGCCGEWLACELAMESACHCLGDDAGGCTLKDWGGGGGGGWTPPQMVQSSHAPPALPH